MEFDEIDRMSDDEVRRRLRKLIVLEPHIETLERVATYEESKANFTRHWKGIVIASSSVIAAAVYLYDKFSSGVHKLLE